MQLETRRTIISQISENDFSAILNCIKNPLIGAVHLNKFKDIEMNHIESHLSVKF
ncbi:hypothetical protein OAI90_03020 [Crocinitomicaceae bacterium]|nr:hypothetical protein [Crocinitomicaceae bacterium]